MKAFEFLLILAIACILSSCKQGYKVENGQVYYEHWNEGSGQLKDLLPTADAKTFQKISFDCDCSFDFGRDKKQLFIDGQRMDNIDPNTFKFRGNYIFTDKDSAYFFGFYNDIQKCSIKGIDFKKLQIMKYPWAKANDILIFGHDTLKLNDIADFQPLDKYWGRTKRNVIFQNRILKNADPNSFEVLNSYSGKDNKHTYEFGRIKD